MTENGEQSPAKSSWTSDNTFIRSRFIVKRLKRMRSQTKSLHEDVDGLFRSPTQEPCSLPYEVNHPSTSPEARFSLPYETNQFACCGSERNVDAMVSDLVNISMANRFRLKEENVSFEEESVQSLSRKPSSHSNTTETRINDKYEENNNCNSLLEILPEPPQQDYLLLEEIEEALPKEYSLKRILFCFYSVTMHRALLRLRQSSFLGSKKDPLLRYKTKAVSESSNSIDSEIKRLDVELVIQKMLMEQARKALTVLNFSKTAQDAQLEAEKALLLTCVKYEAVEGLKEKLRKMSINETDGWWKEDSVCASIKEITIAVENPALWSTYNFIVVAVERDHVKGTGFEYVTRDSALRFTTPLRFYNLSPNFTIHLYLYGIPVKDSKSKLFYRSTERLNILPHKSHKKQNSLGSLTATPHNFTLIGSAVVQRSHFERTTITLLMNAGSNAMEICMRGDVYLNTLYTGFLDIRYGSDRNSSQSVWTHYWFRLTGLYLQGWPYPYQEISQEEDATFYDFQTATHVICLHNCKTEAQPEDIFHCVRPHTFYLTLESEKEPEKIQFSADSAEEVRTWCHHLNKAITACRIWDS